MGYDKRLSLRDSVSKMVVDQNGFVSTSWCEVCDSLLQKHNRCLQPLLFKTISFRIPQLIESVVCEAGIWKTQGQ